MLIKFSKTAFASLLTSSLAESRNFSKAISYRSLIPFENCDFLEKKRKKLGGEGPFAKWLWRSHLSKILTEREGFFFEDETAYDDTDGNSEGKGLKLYYRGDRSKKEIPIDFGLEIANVFFQKQIFFRKFDFFEFSFYRVLKHFTQKLYFTMYM